MEENGEGTHPMQTEDNMEAVESPDPEGSQKNGKARKGNSGKSVKRKAEATLGGKATPKKLESKELSTPLIDRPSRERKSIDRFIDSVEKEKEKPKEFKIEQGSGTYLKDIPNVVFKLSRRKWSDDIVQFLHKLLYNKRVKPHSVKANILQFSGFVWGANEEKEKAKLKEKLDKCVKEQLFQLSDLLDLNIKKTSSKKEEVVMRVFEFLDCPQKTTDKLVQEEEQRLKEKKRKKTPVKGKKKGSGHTPLKRQKREENEEQQDEEEEEEEIEEEEEQEEEALEQASEEDKEQQQEPEEVPVKKKVIKIKEPSRNAKSNTAKNYSKRSAKKAKDYEEPDEQVEEPEEVEPEPDEDHVEPIRKRSRNKKYEDDAVPKSSPKKGSRKPVKIKSVYEPGEGDLDDDVKDVKSKPLSKMSKNDVSKEVASKDKKKEANNSMKTSSRKKKKEHDEDVPEETLTKKGTGRPGPKEGTASLTIPPDDDLRAAICELLRNADFSTVTFTDVVKQLGAKFEVDLSQNKAHVKNLIQEEISKIVDEDDGEGEDVETGVNMPERGEIEPVEAVAED